MFNIIEQYTGFWRQWREQIDNNQGCLDTLRAKARDSSRCKFCVYALFFILIILGLILSCNLASETYVIDSESNIKQQNEKLQHHYVTDMYTSSSCKYGDEELLFKVFETREGCKCSESLYAQECTESQKSQQNCQQIKKADSFSSSLWPFQKNNDLRYPLKICISTTTTTIQQQIDNHDDYKNCTSLDLQQCGEQNDHICIQKTEKCPISKVIFQKQDFANQQANSRIVVLERNHSKAFTRIFVTNGFCNTRQNSSNYTLNNYEKDDCQFQNQITSIANFSLELILDVNQKYDEFIKTRQYDDPTNQVYSINGLQQPVALQCRVKNKMYKSIKLIRVEQQVNVKRSEAILRSMTIILAVIYLYNLYAMYSIINSNPVRQFYYYFCTLIILSTAAVLIWLQQIYIRLENNCLSFKLAELNYSYSIIILIFQAFQMILYYILDTEKVYQVHQVANQANQANQANHANQVPHVNQVHDQHDENQQINIRGLEMRTQLNFQDPTFRYPQQSQSRNQLIFTVPRSVVQEQQQSFLNDQK